jgi:cytochrome c-type biogenesis protein CcmE
VDLSPREVVPTAVGRRRKRPWLAISVLVAVLVGGGVLVVKFLTSAVDYYCNVDEVGSKDGCDVGRNIRVQGVVEKGSYSGSGGQYEFSITYGGVTMPVTVGSEPSGIFQECIPVVVRGRAVTNADGVVVFEGDEVIVKHDNNYDAANKDRVAQANAEAERCSQKG